MRRPNTESTPNKPVTLPRNQLLIRYAVTSPVQTCHDTLFMFIFNYALQPFLRLIVRSGLDVPTFATGRLHTCHHTKAPSGGRWNCGREMSGKFCLNADFHVTFRDLSNAVKLRHGTDGFTSPPKEGVLMNFFHPKNPTASAGCEPANLGSQHATSRPPKPLRYGVTIRGNVTNVYPTLIRSLPVSL